MVADGGRLCGHGQVIDKVVETYGAYIWFFA